MSSTIGEVLDAFVEATPPEGESLLDVVRQLLEREEGVFGLCHERGHIDRRRGHVVFAAVRMLLGISGARLDEKRFDRLVEQQPELLHVFVQRAVRLVDRLLQRVEVYVIPARNLYERLTTTQLSAFNTGDHM